MLTEAQTFINIALHMIRQMGGVITRQAIPKISPGLECSFTIDVNDGIDNVSTATEDAVDAVMLLPPKIH
eukprot:15334525-Ditylum_brightwellii.AAC.1